MRFIAISLAAILVALQYALWIADDGMRALWRLEQEVAARTSENEQKAARNAALEGEVIDLKQGLAAVEEKARSELGMVGADETFYLVTVQPTQASNGAK